MLIRPLTPLLPYAIACAVHTATPSFFALLARARAVARTEKMVASTRVQKLLRRYKLAIAAALTILLIQGLVVWSLRTLEEGEVERKHRRSKLPDNNNQNPKKEAASWERQNGLLGRSRGRWKPGMERLGATAASALRRGPSTTARRTARTGARRARAGRRRGCRTTPPAAATSPS
ncbi:hypothetical protein AAFF_G00408840 [Aldrovandia affinis]|uniref:Uncharacterized protein n=1 Tax=Aldrovandia affinis TaxID=143900 RepID=A0AAD7WKW8_9TELE|nr:hypothetical protein AAFF_G00408840 [Aldrovandia affinis]